MTEWILLIMALAAGPDPADPPTALPVSLDRIRAGLARTPAIDLSLAVPPDYHIEIQGHPYFKDVPPRWDITPGVMPSMAPRGAPALVQVDLLNLGRQVTTAVGKARHARAARAAREEVADALSEFCADRSCDPR